MKFIVVVGSGSGCGKTTLACSLVRAVPGLGAVKVSPRRGHVRVELGPGPPGKDTGLYASAGAVRVARIVGPRGQAVRAWEGLREEFAACRAVVVEGTGGLRLPGERFVIFVAGEGWPRRRARRNAALAAAADLLFERSSPGVCASQVAVAVRKFVSSPSLLLASSSPRRRRLLRDLGVAFSVRSPEVDERPLPGESPAAHVRRLAVLKARAAAGLGWTSGARWVLGADTVVALDGEILGKPRDARDARAMLRRLAGRTHEVLTGVALQPLAGGRARTAVVRSRVAMKPFDAAAIRRYVAGGEPLDKAGAYAVQGAGRRLVASVSGSLSNVVGLPLERVAALLDAAGLPVTPAPSALLDRLAPAVIVKKPGRLR